MAKQRNLINLLKKKRKSLAVAESCSAGYLSYFLTKTPGSSKVFKGGIVVYSLESKSKFFKIPSPLLKKTQGVSGKISLILAKEIRKLFDADIGASLVGFAGPRAKEGIKVGTVFMSIADRKGTETKKLTIKGNRDAIRKKASQYLIRLIYERIK